MNDDVVPRKGDEGFVGVLGAKLAAVEQCALREVDRLKSIAAALQVENDQLREDERVGAKQPLPSTVRVTASPDETSSPSIDWDVEVPTCSVDKVEEDLQSDPKVLAIVPSPTVWDATDVEPVPTTGGRDVDVPHAWQTAESQDSLSSGSSETPLEPQRQESQVHEAKPIRRASFPTSHEPEPRRVSSNSILSFRRNSKSSVSSNKVNGVRRLSVQSNPAQRPSVLQFPVPKNDTDATESVSRVMPDPSSGRPLSSLSGATSAVVFEVLPCWVAVTMMVSSKNSRRSSQHRRSSVSNCSNFDEDKLQQVADLSSDGAWLRFLRQNCMLAPISMTCLAWDMVGVLLIVFDIVMLPLHVFDLAETQFTRWMAWTQWIFWTISIPRSFVTGYLRKDGEVVMCPRKVIRRYLFGWFMFDCIVTSTDWPEPPLWWIQFVSGLRVAKLTHMIRIMRFARMFKLTTGMEEIDAFFFSEKNLLVIGIAKISCLFIFLGHFVACLWYALGRHMENDGASWVRHMGMDAEPFFFRYFTSLHWSLAQFASGNIEIDAQNVNERCFAIVVLIASFIVSAGFVSRITASMTRLQILAGNHESKFAMLRQYLRHHKVSANLAMRVVRSAQYAITLKTKNSLEDDIELLGMISEPLRVEIHYEILAPVLMAHPFFRQYNMMNVAAMRRLCHSSTEVLSMGAGDLLFTEGEVPKVPRMFFVMSGSMVYKRNISVGLDCVLDAKAWACEGALWTKWSHTGNLAASGDSVILALDAETFQQVVTKFLAQAFFAAMYGASFVSHLNLMGGGTEDVNEDFDSETNVNTALNAAETFGLYERTVVSDTEASHAPERRQSAPAVEQFFRKKLQTFAAFTLLRNGNKVGPAIVGPPSS